MMRKGQDPFADAPRMIRRVYGYVAFRMGRGPDAEDVTSEVFERALRYRDSFDPKKGTPTAWLLGIAQRSVDDALRRRVAQPATSVDELTPVATHDADAIERLTLRSALESLGGRDRDLFALRYGVGLSTKQIASALDLKPGAVDVALHRARARLATALARDDQITPTQEAARSYDDAKASAGGA
jgi:RNA polymerase sigma-70 factor, ECF subfamily